jgi:hypothetical protein
MIVGYGFGPMGLRGWARGDGFPCLGQGCELGNDVEVGKWYPWVFYFYFSV